MTLAHTADHLIFGVEIKFVDEHLQRPGGVERFETITLPNNSLTADLASASIDRRSCLVIMGT